MNINFKGYNIIIKNEETDETILMSKVLESNIELNIVEVAAVPDIDISQLRMRVLLYMDGHTAYTYNGTFRKSANPMVFAIALYKGNVKTDRKSERFNINLAASIVELRDPAYMQPISVSIPCTIIDISRSGVRISINCNAPVKLGYRFAVHFTIKDIARTYYGKIIRFISKDDSSEIYEYGCELLTKPEYSA